MFHCSSSDGQFPYFFTSHSFSHFLFSHPCWQSFGTFICLIHRLNRAGEKRALAFQIFDGCLMIPRWDFMHNELIFFFFSLNMKVGNSLRDPHDGSIRSCLCNPVNNPSENLFQALFNWLSSCGLVTGFPVSAATPAVCLRPV